MKRKKLGYNAGFTLVESIVVILMLIVLVGTLTPSFINYTKMVKSKKYISEARNLYIATQEKLTELYSTRSPYQVSRTDPNNMKYAGETAYNILENGRGQNSGAIAGVNDYGFSRDIFKLAGYELFDPYYDYTWYQKCSKNDKNPWNVKQGSTKDNVSFLCIGVGRYDKYLNPVNGKSYDPHKAYTAYFMIYQPNKDSDYYLYNGSNFIDYWPFKKKIYGCI